VHTGGPPAALVQGATGKPLHAVSVSSVSRKLKPMTIAAAGVKSGKRIPIVAPVHERAARAARMESKGGKAPAPGIARHAAPPAKGAPRAVAMRSHGEKVAHERAARMESKGGKAPAPRIAHHAAPPAKGASREVAAPRHGERDRAPSHAAVARHAPPRQAVVARHEVKPSRQSGTFGSGQPPRQAHHDSSAPPPRSVERRHEAPAPAAVREERRTAMNRAAEQPRPARHEAPPPQAFQPRPGPPPAAMARPPEHARPQPQPGGNKKEKPQG